jgi:hypothetical protein
MCPHLEPTFDQTLLDCLTPAAYLLALTFPFIASLLVSLQAAAVPNLDAFQYGLGCETHSGAKNDDAEHGIEANGETLCGRYRHYVAESDSKGGNDCKEQTVQEGE